jgi:hypothetical protein
MMRFLEVLKIKFKEKDIVIFQFDVDGDKTGKDVLDQV